MFGGCSQLDSIYFVGVQSIQNICELIKSILEVEKLFKYTKLTKFELRVKRNIGSYW